MAKSSLALLETALRAKRLDTTLTSALSREEAPVERVPVTLAPIDDALRGGLPKGQLSEIAGPASSGRTTLLLSTFAAATRRGEIVALVDPFDRLDVASAVAAGVDLSRLLWVRGDGCATHGAAGHALVGRALDRGLKALTLILQAGGFGVVAMDLADVPAPALAGLPPATWLRVQRAIEGRDTACVLVAERPLARSAGGLTVLLDGAPARARWVGESARSQRLSGLDVTGRVLSPRRTAGGTFACPGTVVDWRASARAVHAC
jgi:recombination protein RecA